METSDGILDDNEYIPISPGKTAWLRFKKDPLAVTGLVGIVIMLLVALAAPLLANSRPLLFISDGTTKFPFLRYFFAPDSGETFIERFFNYFLIFIPFALLTAKLIRRRRKLRNIIIIVFALLWLIPFSTIGKRMDRTNWRAITSNSKNSITVFAPVRYGPYDQVSAPYLKSSVRHLLGTDQIGRDILSRMIYGTRVSLAVGLMATAISLLIGVTVGMLSGYSGGKFDLLMMRIVEIIICFPTFLLLLILMSLFMDSNFTQSILIVIGVLGLTGWTGLSRLVRGETLKTRNLAYVQSCVSLGVPRWRILLYHILPNITGPILVALSFGIAGAISAESGLSFLGFGVKPPTASWGELLRQAFDNPFEYWHLTLWPGLALFISLCAFNFTGEGLRKALDPKSKS
jgi:peptide/nickel transport system permease protein